MKRRGSVVKANKKKSNSTKSMLSKNVSTLKQDSKTALQNPLKTDKVPFSRSRASKRSDKSQLNSKILPNPAEDEISTKSTYWLRSTTLGKTDKKSTNSSTRMKLRWLHFYNLCYGFVGFIRKPFPVGYGIQIVMTDIDKIGAGIGLALVSGVLK